MKKLIAFSMILMLAFVACDDDNSNENLRISVGTILKTDATTFKIDLDNGKMLNLVNTYTDENLEDGDRVLVEYEIILGEEGDEIDANVYDIEEILTKDVIQLTEEITDSIGDDPIHVAEDDIWLSDHHLNFIFEYYGYGMTHYINLVKPIGTQVDGAGRQILEFRHNANDDYPSRIYRGIVSFNMESLYTGEPSIDFVVRFTNFGSEIIEWEGTYTYEEAISGQAQVQVKEVNNDDFIEMKSIDIQ